MSEAKPDETPAETRARWARDYIMRAPAEHKFTEEYKALARSAGPLPSDVQKSADDFFDTEDEEL